MNDFNFKSRLLKFSECTNIDSIQHRFCSLYANTSMDPICRYTRLALSTIVELWSSDSLLTEHNESWYRTHIYDPVFDNAFTYNKDFVTKRAVCRFFPQKTDTLELQKNRHYIGNKKKILIGTNALSA